MRFLQLRDPLRHLFDGGAQPARARLHRPHALGLRAKQRDVLGDAFELRGQAVGLGIDVGNAATRFLEQLEATFHRGQSAAHIDDALPHRIEPLVLELEPLDRALYLIAQPIQARAELVISLFDRRVVRCDFGSALEHFGVHLFQLTDLRLEVA